MLVYLETNYEFGTTTQVTREATVYRVIHRDADAMQIIGMRDYDISCEREAVAFAKKCCAGEVVGGDFVTL